MGKKMFATLIVAVVAMFAGYNVYQSQNTVVLSELALANVEALANDEGDSGGGGYTGCTSGSGYCAIYWNGTCIFESYSHYPF